jgi:hypothetical protein
MAIFFKKTNPQNPLCWIRQPFYLSPGGENPPQKKTLVDIFRNRFFDYLGTMVRNSMDCRG